MGDRPLSRRQLLAGLMGVGGAGAVTGAGTTALLTDSERVPSGVGSGTLDLLVAWETATDSGTSENGSTFPLAVTRERTSGTASFTVTLPGDGNNPAFVWLRAACLTGRFARSLSVRLSYADPATGAATAELFAGSLAELTDRLADGIALDAAGRPDVAPGEQACLTPDGELGLRLDWSLPDDYDGPAVDESLALEFRGLQCRGRDGSVRAFPSTGGCLPRYAVSYVAVAVADGDDCRFLGKLELEPTGCYDQPGIGDSDVEPGRYDLYTDGDDCVDTGYDLRVTAVAETDGGAETTGLAFELVADDGGAVPDLCRVTVKGGPGTATYGEARLAGSATDGILYAPKRT